MFWNYVGFEEDLNVYSWNKYNFLSNPPDGTMLQPPFPIHTVQPAFDVVFHFTPRDHKFRPFVAFGRWRLHRRAGQEREGLGQFAASLRRVFSVQERRALPGQLRRWESSIRPTNGLASASMCEASPGMAPQFGLVGAPTTANGAYILGNSMLNGVEATGGLTLYLGHRGELPAASASTAAPAPAAASTSSSDQSGRHQRQPDHRLSGRRGTS